ncbi:hypothetical protein HGRIS_014935 [Hohenbuehelia grisea]|uniref:Uncharacterized protein n=1 Tax=Hohenbuehelia grisea TaxID=104357 RepID=A0ABR3K117_9AGAR
MRTSKSSPEHWGSIVIIISSCDFVIHRTQCSCRVCLSFSRLLLSDWTQKWAIDHPKVPQTHGDLELLHITCLLVPPSTLTALARCTSAHTRPRQTHRCLILGVTEQDGAKSTLQLPRGRRNTLIDGCHAQPSRNTVATCRTLYLNPPFRSRQRGLTQVYTFSF